MAEYVPIDKLGIRNAIANITTQTAEQRNAFSGGETNILGASRADMTELFDHTPDGRDSDESIMLAAYNHSLDMYEAGFYTASGTTYNPDFDSPELELGYNNTPNNATRLTSTGQQDDKPNPQGPNIKSFSIDEDGNPDIPDGTERTETGHLPKNRGFGVSEGQTRTIGSYLRRRWDKGVDPEVKASQRPQLGEYKNHDGLTYSDIVVFDPSDS